MLSIKTFIFPKTKLWCCGLSLVALVAGCETMDTAFDEEPQVETTAEALSSRGFSIPYTNPSNDRTSRFTPTFPSHAPYQVADTPSMCSNKRWVGVTQSSSCPGGGEAWKLYYVSGDNPPISDGLKKLCAYELADGLGNADPADYLNRLPEDGHDHYYDWLSRDCQIMTTFSDDVHSPLALGEGFNSQILEQIDALPAYPFKAQTGRSWVQVSVVDNDPTSSSIYDPSNMNWVLGPGVSGHGYALARLIENVVNPPGQIYKAQIELEQGLLNSAPDTEDKVKGGYTGTPWQLAQAIHRVVDRYISRVVSSKITPPRLVINLSVGWDPSWGGEFASNPGELNAQHPGLRAVYDELFHARCYGALIFAAAGNSLKSSDTDAAFPAAWEKLSAPTQDQCTEFEDGFDYSGWSSTRFYRWNLEYKFSRIPAFSSADPAYNPLLFAVSGVMGNDSRLINARPESVTRFVAPGAFGAGVTYPNVQELRPDIGIIIKKTSPTATKIMTGTSVSTALASATAAVLWSYSPSKTPAQIADVMYRGAVQLHRKTDVWLAGQTSSASMRLSVCGAMKKLCLEEKGFTCPNCSITGAYEGELSELNQTMFDAIVASNNYCQSGSQPSATCQPLDASNYDSGDASPDDTLLSGYALPRVSPQPINVWCPTCSIRVNNSFNEVANPIDVMLQVSPDFNSTVNNPTVTLYDESGEVVSELDLPLNSVEKEKSYWIAGIAPTENLSGVTSAVVTGETTSIQASGAASTAMAISQVVPIMR